MAAYKNVYDTPDSFPPVGAATKTKKKPAATAPMIGTPTQRRVAAAMVRAGYRDMNEPGAVDVYNNAQRDFAANDAALAQQQSVPVHPLLRVIDEVQSGQRMNLPRSTGVSAVQGRGYFNPAPFTNADLAATTPAAALPSATPPGIPTQAAMTPGRAQALVPTRTQQEIDAAYAADRQRREQYRKTHPLATPLRGEWRGGEFRGYPTAQAMSAPPGSGDLSPKYQRGASGQSPEFEQARIAWYEAKAQQIKNGDKISSSELISMGDAIERKILLGTATEEDRATLKEIKKLQRDRIAAATRDRESEGAGADTSAPAPAIGSMDEWYREQNGR